MARLLATLLTKRVAAQHLIVTTIAITLAWAIGQSLSEVDAMVAAIIAAITLRRSVHGSLSEAFIQVLGTALGIAIAFLSLNIVGDSIGAIAVTVVTTLLVGRIFNLGEEGALSILITAIIIIGPGFAADTAVDRAWGTVIGVSIALIFSFWMHPLTPVERTDESVAKLTRNSGKLLADMAQGVRQQYNLSQAGTWLERARVLDMDAESIRAQATEATRYARWSPLVSRTEAQQAYRRFIAAEHTVVQVRTIARTFYDAALTGTPLPNSAAKPVAEALHAASKTVTATASRGREEQREYQLTRIRNQAQRAAAALVEHDHPSSVVLGAALVSNITRIADTLELDSPAIVKVASPEVDPTPLEAAAYAVGRKARKARVSMRTRTRGSQGNRGLRGKRRQNSKKKQAVKTHQPEGSETT